MPKISVCYRTYVKAAVADSFITSPNCPVNVKPPFPFIFDDSINKISPPAAVHAKPVTTPGFVVLSAISE